MTQSSNRDAWRKFLGIGNPSAQLNDARNGGLVPRVAGKSGWGSGGAGGIQGDIPPPDGSGEESAEKGDGGADLGKPLKPGDKFDRFEDLYDCETGEKVTIDGFGKDGSQKFPSGFEDCKAPKVPTMADLDGKTIYRIFSNNDELTGIKSNTYHLSLETFTAGSAKAKAYQDGRSTGGCKALNIPSYTPTAGSEFWLYQYPDGKGGCTTPSADFATTVGYQSSTSEAYKQAYIDGYEAPKWPAVDRNHLNWNKEKGCFEPLCPDSNNQVLDKYSGCDDEIVLCDKDGNKVKVKADGNQVAVTQEKFNQTAYVRNGKVETVKKLTESQTENEFK